MHHATRMSAKNVVGTVPEPAPSEMNSMLSSSLTLNAPEGIAVSTSPAAALVKAMVHAPPVMAVPAILEVIAVSAVVTAAWITEPILTILPRQGATLNVLPAVDESA